LIGRGDQLVQLSAKPNFRALGKKFGKSTPLAAKAVEALSSDSLRRLEQGERITIALEGGEHAIDVGDLEVVRRAVGELVVKEAGGRFVALDPHLTPELRAEGVARELVSRIQRLRKSEGLAVSDRIQLWLWGAEELEEAARTHKEWIAGEVLARAMHVGPNGTHTDIATHTVEIDGLTVNVALTIDAGL
jgi:isoleucyl-tRNA synthetase